MDDTSQETNKFLVPVAIVIAGALIAGAIYMGDQKPVVVNNQQPSLADIKFEPVGQQDHFLGSRDAEVVIIEYSDTECPFCKVFHNTMKQVMRDYEGKVAWVYRQFPIPQLHARAAKEAEATECVAELGGNQAFWTYLDKIFETTNSNDSLDPAQLPILAGEVGIDVVAFNNCLSSGKYTKFIEDQIVAANKVGARGTPYSIIVHTSGEKNAINGAEPIASVKAKIDALLEN